MTKIAILERFGLVFISLVLAVDVSVAATLSPQQLKLVQQLPSQQRDMALRLLNEAGPTLGRNSRQESEGNNKVQRGRAAVEKKDSAAQADVAGNDGDVPRINGGDTVIVYFDQPKLSDNPNGVVVEPELVLEQRKKMFVLDKYGVLDMPNVGRIPLAGLSEMEAAARISLEPLLTGYDITVVRLPLEPIGSNALEPFGYDLFNRENAEDGGDGEPNLPVPLDYIVGPGDTCVIQLFGKESMEYELVVSREGDLLFPGIGSVPVAGLTFKELKASLERRVAKQFIGVKAHITMGELRSIRVFLLGEVTKPGAYTVGALSNVTNAIFTAGGIKKDGSLRQVQVKRDGKVVAKLDFYDLLLRGDNRADIRLRAGDVIFVPLAQSTVGVGGEVRRPAVYELTRDNTVADVIELAGGVLPGAYPERAQVERFKAGQGRSVIDVNLVNSTAHKTVLQNGDVVTVGALPDRLEKVVFAAGHLRTPRPFQWQQGMRLTDVVRSTRDLKPNADLDYVVVKREDALDGHIELVSASLRDALASPNGKNNLELNPRDEVIVFDLSPNRHLLIKPIIEQLRLQATNSEPAHLVRISGEVRTPGTYPLERGMRISDLLRAGGYLKESAYALSAELTRYISGANGYREIEHISVELAAILHGDNAADLALQSYDQLTIKQLPQWEEQNLVAVHGEVRFPGEFPIRRGETLGTLLQRAGGLTGYAYAQGAVFTREELREREQERLDTMASNLERELAVASAQQNAPDQQEALDVTKKLLGELRTAKAAGRLVINLERENSKTYDLVLKGGDELFVPAQMQEVTVMGEVFHPTSHLYNRKYSWKDYVASSGGTTRKADEHRTYIIRANGSVLAAKRGFLSRPVSVQPGDTVVVPLDANHVSPLKLMTDVSTILYQVGLAAAAWNTIGVFK